MVAITFGALTATNVATLLFGEADVALYMTVFVALLPYALFRWASGREAAIGLTIILLAALISSVTAALGGSAEDVILGPLIGTTMFLLFPAALGALVRFETNSRLSEMEHVKLTEREQLARELHDTVAHHVSAIAIQAQAGRTLADSHPDAAVDTLRVIEAEASLALAEMRTMVGVLREGEAPDLAPQPGVADIERLAYSAGDSPRVAVELTGDLDDLTPTVEAAIYRLAQESITNAVRHARNATRINVSVAGDVDCVRLTVRDDGDASSTGRTSSGYGLVGMTERATLLGGTLMAGPDPDTGWTITAVLPTTGTGA